MVAYDPLRGVALKQHPKVDKDKNGNVSSKSDPQINSTLSTGVERAEPTEPVSGTSSGELVKDGKVKAGQVFNTSTGETEDVPAAGDTGASSGKSKKG